MMGLAAPAFAGEAPNVNNDAVGGAAGNGGEGGVGDILGSCIVAAEVVGEVNQECSAGSGGDGGLGGAASALIGQ
jgi:hypothetical protein